MSDTPANKTYARNQRIISAGETADIAYQIESGSAHVFLDKDGKIVTLARLESGAIFGEMALCTGEPYTANVEATSDETVLSTITPAMLQDKIAAADPLLEKILKTLISRLTNTNSALLESETRDYIEIDLI